jgi:hypothetical protein
MPGLMQRLPMLGSINSPQTPQSVMRNRIAIQLMGTPPAPAQNPIQTSFQAQQQQAQQAEYAQQLQDAQDERDKYYAQRAGV